MKALWLAHMLPTKFNWLAGPWNVRSLVALRDYEDVEVRAVCPVGLTPPSSLVFRFPPDPKGLRDWFNLRKATAQADQVQSVPITYPRWGWPPKAMFWGYEGWFLYRQIRKHLARIVQEYRPDVIHAPWINPEGVAACLMSLEHGIPCVVQGIGNDANYYLQKYPGRNYVIDRIEKAATLLFNCRSVRNMAEAAGLRNKNTVIIYHGVEVDLFKPDPDRTEFGRKVITVAQLIPRKNHQLLLKAFARLPADLKDSASLEFVGGGPCREPLRQQAEELGIADRVHFAGQPSHADLIKQLQQADVFCLPTLSEGMPVAIIEAMACGLPVVASKVDGIPESVQDDVTGILVPPQDVDALRDSLQVALTRDWDRQAIRQAVLDKFTWRLYAKNIAELYQSLIR